MEKEQRDKLVKGIANTPHGRALELWLEEEIDTLKDVTKASGGLEVFLGRQEAIKILRKLFNFIYVRPTPPKGKTDYR